MGGGQTKWHPGRHSDNHMVLWPCPKKNKKFAEFLLEFKKV